MRDHNQNTAGRADGLEPLEPRMLFCATGAVTADLTTGLDAWWRFSDEATSVIADDSGSTTTHPGTLNGAASVSALGLCGPAGRFDGGEMNIANHGDINLGTQTQRTIALWFLADDVEAPGRQMLYEEGAAVRGLNIYIEAGTLVVGGWNQPGGESNWQGTWLVTHAIVSGHWHHVVLTLDGGPTLEPDAIHGYLDGEHFGSGAGSQLWSHSGDVTVGGVGDTRFPDGTAGATGFLGLIDDFRLYNRALDAHDVAVLSGRFNEGAAISLATHWRDDLVALLGFIAVADVPEGRPILEVEFAVAEFVLPPQPEAASAETHAAPGTDAAPGPVIDPESVTEAPPGQPVASGSMEGQGPGGVEDTGDGDGGTPSDSVDPQVAEVETAPKRGQKPCPPEGAGRPNHGQIDLDAAHESRSHLHRLSVREEGHRAEERH